MVVVCMLLMLCAMVPMMFIQNLYGTIACLAGGFFFAEMTIGPMWSIPLDVASQYSGSALGFMNIGSASAAIVSPVVSGFLIDHFANWNLPFFCCMALMAVGIVLSFGMRPDKPFRHGADNSDSSAIAPQPKE